MFAALLRFQSCVTRGMWKTLELITQISPVVAFTRCWLSCRVLWGLSHHQTTDIGDQWVVGSHFMTSKSLTINRHQSENNMRSTAITISLAFGHSHVQWACLLKNTVSRSITVAATTSNRTSPFPSVPCHVPSTLHARSDLRTNVWALKLSQIQIRRGYLESRDSVKASSWSQISSCYTGEHLSLAIAFLLAVSTDHEPAHTFYRWRA